MASYYANRHARPDGCHEVHIDDDSCLHPPELNNRDPLGWHETCDSAVSEAKSRYAKADGCAYCTPDCHAR